MILSTGWKATGTNWNRMNGHFSSSGYMKFDFVPEVSESNNYKYIRMDF